MYCFPSCDPGPQTHGIKNEVNILIQCIYVHNFDHCKYEIELHVVKILIAYRRVTPPFLVRSIQGGFRQYAKGRYAVRRDSVISYADINFYFKKVQFL